MALARILEAIVVVVCLFRVIHRYRGGAIRFVPGDIILWAFSLFFIVPLILDAIRFVPSFTVYPTFGTLLDNPTVSVIAALAILYATLVITAAVEKSAHASEAIEFSGERRRGFWLVLALCPIGVVLLAPEPGLYLHHFAAYGNLRGYGEPFYTDGLTPNPVLAFQTYVNAAVYVSAVGLAMWVYTRKSKQAFWLVPPIMLMDFSLEGKRNILAITAILIVFALVARRGKTRGGRGLVVAALLFGGLLVASQVYQAHFRPTVLATQGSRQAFDVDFGRTNVLRLAIAGQIGDAPRPLSYPGQSIPLYAQQFTDRITHHKPISYEDRVTSIAEGSPIQALPGAVTTSILSEAIDNFWLFGIVIGPWLLVLLIRWGGRTRDPMLRLLIPIFGALIIATNIVATAPLIALILVRLAWNRTRRDRPATSDLPGLVTTLPES